MINEQIEWNIVFMRLERLGISEFERLMATLQDNHVNLHNPDKLRWVNESSRNFTIKSSKFWLLERRADQGGDKFPVQIWESSAPNKEKIVCSLLANHFGKDECSGQNAKENAPSLLESSMVHLV